MQTEPQKPVAEAACLRQCPTTIGDYRPLIAHTVGPDLCMTRQRDMYHKCHRCVFRGKPASFVYDDGTQSANA